MTYCGQYKFFKTGVYIKPTNVGGITSGTIVTSGETCLIN